MALRTTRQETEVLAAGAGSLRATRQTVAVLAAGVGAMRATRQVVEVLAEPGAGEVIVSCSNAFGFTAGQSATTPVFVMGSNDFNFQQIADHNIVVLSVSNNFSLAADIGSDYTEDLIQYIGWTPRSVFPISNSLFSVFDDHPQRLLQATVLSISNDFSLDAAILEAHNVENTFVFSETLQSAQVEALFNEFGFQATINSTDTDYDRDDEQHCLKQHLSFNVSGRCVEREYRPFVGAGGDDSYDDIETTAPTLTPSVLTLTYPFVAPSLTLVLKNPTFGNTSTLTKAAIFRKTRGGDEHIAADDAWPETDLESFEIENLCSTDIDDVIAFLNASLGKLVGLTDWEGRSWSGLIITPDTKITQTGRNSWSFSLVFQKS